MPSKKKKFNSRFPPARIKKIMQTDEDVGKVAAAVPVIISRSLEMFIQSLILKAGETTTSRNAKTLTISHIKQTIESEKKFDFLRDLVANIPDHQPEDEGETSKPEKVKGRVGRPRKIKDGEEASHPKRCKNRQKSSDSSEANENEDDAENSSTESDNGGDEEEENDADGGENNNSFHNNNPFCHEAALRLPHPSYGMGLPPPLGTHPFNTNMGGMIPTSAMGMHALPNYNMMSHLPPMARLPSGMPPPFPPMGYPPFDRMPYPLPHLSHPHFSPLPSSSGVHSTLTSQLTTSTTSTTSTTDEEEDYDT